MHTYVNVYINIHIHTHKHKHTHTQTHAHHRARRNRPSLQAPAHLAHPPEPDTNTHTRAHTHTLTHSPIYIMCTCHLCFVCVCDEHTQPWHLVQLPNTLSPPKPGSPSRSLSATLPPFPRSPTCLPLSSSVRLPALLSPLAPFQRRPLEVPNIRQENFPPKPPSWSARLGV